METKNEDENELAYYGTQEDELYHHGILGQKWGVRRYQNYDGSLTTAGQKRLEKKENKSSKLKTKAFNYDKKAAKYTKKSEKIHSKKDLERSNRKATKAASFAKKAAVLSKRASKITDNDHKRIKLEKKAAKYVYKSSKKKLKGDLISKTTGYSLRAMKYSKKANRSSVRAAKARRKIANNNYYIDAMKRKVSTLSSSDTEKGKSFVNTVLEKQTS